MESSSQPCPELKLLNFLVGSWDSEGEVAGSLIKPATKIKGTDMYEWVSGGFFLLHRVEVMMGEEKVTAVEIIGGYDVAGKTYPMRSFDSQGNFITMQAGFEKDGVLKISGEKMQATLELSKDGKSMTAKWERSDDGSAWVSWLQMKFIKKA